MRLMERVYYSILGDRYFRVYCPRMVDAQCSGADQASVTLRSWALAFVDDFKANGCEL